MRSKKKRLLFFDFITHYGGAQRSTVLLCSRLKKQYDIQIVDAYGCCEPYLSAMSAAGLPIHVLSHREKDVVIGHSERPVKRFITMVRQGPIFINLLIKLKAILRRLQPALVWTNNTKAFFLLCACAHANPAPLGLYAHGWYHRSQISWWQRQLIKKFADVIFAVSNPTKEAMIAWGVAPHKIDVVYAALDFERLLNSTAGLSHIKNDCSAFTILVPGSLLYAKGQHTVIRAVNLIREQGIDQAIRIWLAGDTGVGDTSGYTASLKAEVERYGMTEDVHFLGWRDDMVDLMRRADVVVLPTHTEGLPLAIQEAIILKRPVITTNVGGIPDLITDGETGYAIAVEDVKALASKISLMLHPSMNTYPFAESAYHRYIERFNCDSQLKLFLTAVEKALVA